MPVCLQQKKVSKFPNSPLPSPESSTERQRRVGSALLEEGEAMQFARTYARCLAEPVATAAPPARPRGYVMLCLPPRRQRLRARGEEGAAFPHRRWDTGEALWALSPTSVAMGTRPRRCCQAAQVPSSLSRAQGAAPAAARSCGAAFRWAELLFSGKGNVLPGGDGMNPGRTGFKTLQRP